MRPITISLSPNTEADDVWLAFCSLFTPWNWFSKKGQEELSNGFKLLFQTEAVFFYNSGRSAMYELLKAHGIGEGDEVIVQAFTCVAVPNSVLWNGAQPIYADIDQSYNLTVETIKRAYSKQTKAIIVQHTFGIPAEIDKIITFAKQHNLIVIEDCAHAMGASYQGKLLGTWGDAAFFSFGRDKVISSVFGGAAIVNLQPASLKRQRGEFTNGNSQFEQVNKKLGESLNKMKRPSYWWVFQQVFHPVAFAIIIPLYQLIIGKILLLLLQKLGLLSFPVYPEEKVCHQPLLFPTQYPGALTRMALNQFKKLHRYNEQRRIIAAYYDDALKDLSAITLPSNRDGSIFMRYPVLVPKPQSVINHAKKQGILLGNWYRTVIDPRGVDFSKAQYNNQQCPVAEAVSQQVINLPTRITVDEAKQVVRVLKNVIR